MKRPGRAVLPLTIAVWTSGCKEADDKPCNPYLHFDESFALAVMQPVAPNDINVPSYFAGLPSCGLDDVHQGDSFSLTLQDHFPASGTGDQCQIMECPADFPSAASSTNQRKDGDSLVALPYVCVKSSSVVQVAQACELERYVALISPNFLQDLYNPGASAGSGPFIMIRALFPSTGPAVCSDLSTRYPNTTATRGVSCADLWQVSFSKR